VDAGDRRGVDRLTIQEAARRLGISEGAVRKRVARGSLQHEKDDDGRVYVYLDAGGRRRVDEGVDPNRGVLISQLRDEVAFLRDQVRRQQEIIAQQAVTMRQLTAAPSQEATKGPQTAEETQEAALHTGEKAGQQTGEDTLSEAEQREEEVRQLHASLDQMTDEMQQMNEDMQGNRSVYLLFGVVTAVAVGIAYPLSNSSLIMDARSPWTNLAYVLWIIPTIYGYWLGRSYLTPSVRAQKKRIQMIRTEDRLNDLHGDTFGGYMIRTPTPYTVRLYGIGAVTGLGAATVTVLGEAFRASLGPGLGLFLSERPVILYLVAASVGAFLSTFFFILLAGLVGTGNTRAEAASKGTPEYREARMVAVMSLIGVIIAAVLSFLAVLLPLFISGGN